MELYWWLSISRPGAENSAHRLDFCQQQEAARGRFLNKRVCQSMCTSYVNSAVRCHVPSPSHLQGPVHHGCSFGYVAGLGCGRATNEHLPLKSAGPFLATCPYVREKTGELGVLGGGAGSMWSLCSPPYSHSSAEHLVEARLCPFSPTLDMRAGTSSSGLTVGGEKESNRKRSEQAWELAGVTRWKWRSGRERSRAPREQ